MNKIIILTAIVATLSQADNLKEAEKLYKEANCAKCHLSTDKFDPNSTKKEGLSFKSKNFKDVKQWIINCDDFFNVGWFPEEQTSVAKLLNKKFYKFKE